MKKVAMLGAGAMGARMVHNFLNAGYQVTVYNRSPEKLTELKEKGALIAATPKAAAENADCVMSMVRDDAASNVVWLGKDGAIEGLRPGAIAMESSTVTPHWTRTLADRVQGAGTTFLSAPVLGSRPQVEAKKLIYVVGGDGTALEKVRAILETTSAAIHHVGTVEQAATMKLVVNSQYAAQVAIWAETLSILEKQGIATEKAVEMLNTFPATSLTMQMAGKLMAVHDNAPLFPVELMTKDIGYTADLAKALHVHTEVLNQTHALLSNAASNGYGEKNITSVFDYVRSYK